VSSPDTMDKHSLAMNVWWVLQNQTSEIMNYEWWEYKLWKFIMKNSICITFWNPIAKLGLDEAVRNVLVI